MNEQEACERLRQAGIAEGGIAQLLRLRRMYHAEEAKLEELAAFRRLQFVRWLVRTGRLTEQEVEERKPV